MPAKTCTEVNQLDARLPALEPRTRPWRPVVSRTGLYQSVKVAFEFCLALILLALSLPVILLAALVVKLTSRGSVLYSQIRQGKNGRPYRIYKIRTMVQDAEGNGVPQWCRPGDPRVTTVGRFLRRTHIDELPQLWNVLRGEMSLVGPRPERPEIAEALEPQIPDYRTRLQVRPGVTGLAQVQLPADTDVTDVARKLDYDLYYVQNFGFWLDLRIILGTGLHMLGVPFATVGRLFRLPPPEMVERPRVVETPTPTNLNAETDTAFEIQIA
jgi:lipopolysaccharide/colanic/teichoic acid biosynthesis glycosyltransferase